MNRRTKGFTLIELMITVVIVAILAAVAVPSYREYVMKARRADATSALLRVHAAKEKFLLANNQLPTSIDMLMNGDSGAGVQGVGNVGLEKIGSNYFTPGGHYRVWITTGGSLSSSAVPQGSQANDKQCLRFWLNLETGRRSSVKEPWNDSTDICWGG